MTIADRECATWRDEGKEQVAFRELTGPCAMADGHTRRLTREELIAALRRMVKERRHEGITIHQFCESLRIAQRQVYRQFRSWRELREAAGLKTPRAPIHEQFSNTELIREYQRVVRELGRLPNEIEFNRKANCCYATLKKRFGGAAGIRRVLKITEEADAAAREDHGQEPLFRKSKHSFRHPPLGEAYLREEWAAVRVSFALASSELRGCTAPEFELLFCLRHDWPACPCKVIELHEVWRHPLDRQPADPPPPADTAT